ncbi:Vacuolar protein sorting-associated protein 29 [Intoshia linei]|uniref:Vacuolar protein sorting-associated protein 29 n=1 Tax=Intoshia linei TaxID=1819745 RepID=A0A177B0N7_9BILA|nr:Vacuolar protein sorting-associated protein 29 [Intoshia linei]
MSLKNETSFKIIYISTPGGMNLLEKLYTDVQDPLYRATQENFMVYKKEPKEIKDEDRGKLMTDPIPNPWSKKSKYTDVMLSKFKKPSHPKSILKNSKFKSNLKSSDTADIKDSNFSEDTRKFFKYLAENRLMGGSTEVSANKTNKTPVSENSKVEVDDNLLESMSSMVNMNDLSKIISSNLSNTSNQSSTQNNSEIKNDSNTMNMLTQMLQSMQTTDTMQQSRDEKFTDELEQLKNMGFSDVQKNIEVLTICNGDFILVIGDFNIPLLTTDIPLAFKGLLKSKKINRIICTGNFCSESTLNDLRRVNLNLCGSFGDYDSLVYRLPSISDSLVTTIQGLKFGIFHGHNTCPVNNCMEIKLMNVDMDCDVVITGNNTECYAYTSHGKIYLNPGSATGTSFLNGKTVIASFILLDIAATKKTETNMTAYLYRYKDGLVDTEKLVFR